MDRNSKFSAQNYDETIYGIDTIKEGHRVAFLYNVKTATITDEDLIERTALSLYMIEPNGNMIHAYLKFPPYFYVTCNEDLIKEMMVYLEKKFEKKMASVELVEKVDLDMTNYLSGKLKKYIKLNFRTINDLMFVRNIIRTKVEQTKKKVDDFSFNNLLDDKAKRPDDLMDSILEMREYDVPYHIRVCIDKNLRTAFWYSVSFKDNYVNEIELLPDKTGKPELHILAFDIETTKLPMKFPDAKFDQIMMISYVIDGKGYLITNRQIISADIQNFEYTPKPEFECRIKVYNEPNEAAVIDRFFAHIRKVKPLIIVSYNGDFFDWPFVEARAKVHNLNMHQLTGIQVNNEEYYGRYVTHMDCMCWVNRDSYLPQGSRGLKNVTKHKLGYNPIELDPEMMLPLAREDPQLLSQYSVSDAIATYYLYMKHIHDFIFALCTIIPTFPDEVLRSGSGTLCENLLMAEAFKRNIIFPNKKKEEFEKFFKGHLLNSETYIGGKVECINSGVYREDIPTRFRLEPEAYHHLMKETDKILEFIIETELGMNVNEITNFDEIKSGIVAKLQSLSEVPANYDCQPLIYHLDVAAMYPNIILTNRLQPTAIVNDKTCSGCLFNRPESNCKRNLNWEWKGEYFPLTRSEYEHVKVQIEYEHLKNSENEKSFYELPQDEQQLILKKRVKEMSQKVYKQVYQTKIELKENTVCMRSNSFYVDTIRDFRDRRYEFKNLVKVWKGKMQECESKDNTVGAQEAKEMSIMYESLQLAHKIILNSFYGYVMRRGARWYSMEMAAMVTHIGSNIISDAKGLIDRIGKPLELDTDGIWCLLPKGFPENFTFSNTQGKKFRFSFPCSMLNLLIHEKYLNPQYQTLIDPKTLKYDIKKEMSVFFEVDGPYKAMIIPAAREENKMLKKRYVVYNRDGSIAEVKGFELKRRGELKIIKIFQEDLFNHFLDGQTLEECYLACGATAERWLDILYKHGEGVNDEELLEYIGESKMLSRNIADYDKQRGVALTAAKRMAEFLGSDILQGKGLNCFFIISQKPVGLPISERVIPAMIFNAEEATKRRFLNKWLKDVNISNTDMRNIIDWDYYIDRLGNSIQKVLTIPAALQKVKNPVPRVPYPDWLHKLVRDYDLKFEQKKINSFFHKPSSQPAIENQVMDVEDILPNPTTSAKKSTIKSFLNLGKSQTSSARESIGKGFVISSQHQASGSQFLASSSQDAMPSIPRDVFFDMNTEFDNWLKWQKGLWRARRKGDAGSKRKSDPKNSIGSMFRSQEEHVIASVWHVLQVCETETPGIYKLWIYLENSQIFSVKVKARRTFYVNSLVKTDLEAYKLVKKRLPRNKKAFYLYETVMDEENFVNEFHSFDEFLTNPDYEGVYENKVPLDFKIICDVGSVVRFNRNKSKHYNGHAMYTFDVDELKQIYDKPYLNDFNIPILVISQISMKGKMIWSVFNNNLGEFNFFIVERNHVPNNYKKIVKDILRENNEEAQDMVFKISVNSYEKDEIVMTHIEQYLQQLKDRNRNTPYIIVLQTQYKLPRLNQLGLKSIMNSYPTLHLPVVDSSEISFSSLDWQLKGIRHLTYQYLNMNEYLDELLGFCRYSNIPFCNIGHDRLNFVTDVVYARILKKANCISWYSMTGVPETGGGKMDDARELIPTDFIPSEVINPNLYTDFCVEIDIELLARNAICASDELKSLESENSTAVDFSTLEEPKVNTEGPRAGDERRAGDDLDETVVSRAAFHLVKVMADIWSLDVVNHSNEYADRLLGNLQRWVCDEESRFYDVMLHKMLNILMKKVYGYLLQRLKNLGAKIVYASPSKIIIGTGKYVFHEAENYSQFILRTVISYPIFSDLNLSPKKYWKILLLKDRFNYGGITEDEEKKIDFTWNVSEYLPPQLSRQLLVTLADYINKVSKFIERILEDDITEPGARLQEFHEKVANLSKRHVTEILSYHMFEAIPRLNEYFKEYQIRAAELKEQQLQNAKRKERLNGEEEEEVLSQRSNEDSFEEEYDQDKNAEIKEWEFPQVLGRIPEYKNGVLELIKFLSHILTYDENVQDETVIMKRNCLKLLGMSDFAEEAKYIEPCKKFVLTDIVCKGCSNVIEVDVFRDKIFKDKDFNCQVCGTKFDERRLETKIIKLLKQYVIFYQIQDLYCSKCKMAKSELLDNLCKCSGKYVMREDTPAHGFKTEQKQLIRSFEELATHCDFPLLRDYLLELRFESSLSI